MSCHLGKERKWNPRWAAVQPAATWTVANVVVLKQRACCYILRNRRGPSVFCGSMTIWLLVWAKTVLPQPRCIWKHLPLLEESLWFLALHSCSCPFLSRKISTYQMSIKILLQSRFSSNATMKNQSSDCLQPYLSDHPLLWAIFHGIYHSLPFSLPGSHLG